MDVLTIPQCDRIQREEFWQVLFSPELTLNGNSDLGRKPNGLLLCFTHKTVEEVFEKFKMSKEALESTRGH